MITKSLLFINCFFYVLNFFRVAAVIDGEVRIIPNREGNLKTPSQVTFDSDGNVFVGDMAAAKASEFPGSTVYDIQAVIGETRVENLKQKAVYWPFEVFGRDEGLGIGITVSGKKKIVAPEEICGLILNKLKMDAERYLSLTVHNVVFAVPSQFNFQQREALQMIAKAVGLTVLKFVNDQ